jgi:nitric oxide reductase large subunit
MFDQPPLTAKEVFGRGFVHGSAMMFGTLLFSLISMLPSRSRFYMGSNGSPSIDLLFVWPLLGTIGCVVLLFGKEERTALYRAGVLISYALFLAMTIAMWEI